MKVFNLHKLSPIHSLGPKISKRQAFLKKTKQKFLPILKHNQTRFQVNETSEDYLEGFIYVNDINETVQFCSTTLHPNYSSTFKCDFEKMLEHCNFTNSYATPSTVNSFKFNSDPDVLYSIKWFQLIFTIYLQPMLSLIGILTNLIVILVVKAKMNMNLFKDKMYSFIAVNAFFNIAYCIIMGVKLVNECVFFTSSTFCSIFYRSHAAQYFKIIVVHFLGSVFKVSMNLSYISFALSRLILTSQTKKQIFLKFNKIKTKYFIIGIVLISILLSVYKLFQYKLNRIHLPYQEFPHEKHDEMSCLSGINELECKMFNSFKIINSSLNDIVLFLLNIIIDIFLYKSFKSQLESKRLAKGHFFTIEHHEELKSKQNRLNKMIFFNGIFYFVSHFPEFFTTILLIRFAKKLSEFCAYQFSCDLFNENASFFNMISIVSQFFLYVSFNKNFLMGFKKLIGNFPKEQKS